MAKIKSTRRRVQLGFENGIGEDGKVKIKRNSLTNLADNVSVEHLVTLGEKYATLIDKRHLQTKRITEEEIIDEA